jgi:hypothetical protein
MPKRNALSARQKTALKASIAEFHRWLEKELPGSVAPKRGKVRFPKPDRDDWIMWVDKEHEEVCFNSHVLSKCSFLYFELIVIHEWFEVPPI